MVASQSIAPSRNRKFLLSSLLLGMLVFSACTQPSPTATPGSIQSWLLALNPMMNQGFYWIMFVTFTVIYLFVWANTRVNYWEFRPNEVIHRYGFFSKAKRYRPELIRWDRVMPDVMERLLLGTGTMVLTTSQEPHPLVLEHVPGVSRVDERIAAVLGVNITATHPGSG